MTQTELEKKAGEIRQTVIKMLTGAGSGHSAGSLGLADFFTALYFDGILKYHPNEPWSPGRDRFVLSAGHLVPVLYATLAHAGFFPLKELDTLRQFNSRLEGHPHRRQDFVNHQPVTSTLPGIEATAGPLGQGLSVAVGMALALKHHSSQPSGPASLPRVICLLSDGELQEGQTWEAFMSASKFRLEHLTFVIDRNHIQIGGLTEDIMPLEPLKAKLEAFGLFTIDIDGHNFTSIKDAFSLDAAIHHRPTAIIAHTIPGKGVSYMENLPEWHGKPPQGPGEAVEALKQIRQLGGKITYD